MSIKIKGIKIVILTLLISVFAGYSINAEDLTYGVEMGSLTTDGKFFPKGSSTNTIDINKNIAINPSYLQYNYTSTKKDRFQYCINTGCTLKNAGDRYQGYLEGISINNNQKITIDYSQLNLGENRISYMTFDDTTRSTDSISFYIYYYDLNVSATVSGPYENINPTSASATSNKDNVRYSWQIVDLDNNIKNIGTGAAVSEASFKDLTTGKYQIIFKGIYNDEGTDITSYGMTSFEIKKPKVTISIDKTINPSSITVTKTINESTISWEIFKTSNNEKVGSGTSSNVSLPTVEGEYKLSAKEISPYGDENSSNITFTVSNPDITINAVGGKQVGDYLINPTEFTFSKKIASSTITCTFLKSDMIIYHDTTDKFSVPNLANGDYYLVVTERSAYNIYSTKELKIRIENPDVKINIDNNKNPNIISIIKKSVNSTLSWTISKDNSVIANGTSSNVTIPKEYGEYLLEAKEITRYGDESSNSLTFIIEKPINGDKETIKSGKNTYYYTYKNGKWFNNKTVNVNGSTTTTSNFAYNASKCKGEELKPNNCSALIQKIVQVKSGSKVIKTTEYKYNNYQKLTLHKIIQRNSSNKNIVIYQRTISYYTNKKVNTNTIIKRSLANKYTSRIKVKYRSNGYKYYQIKFGYKSGKTTSRYEYRYNKRGQTKSNKYGSAYRYKTTYKKGKAYRTYRAKYSSKGKLSKAKTVKRRTAF